jgi:hypothetical protein
MSASITLGTQSAAPSTQINVIQTQPATQAAMVLRDDDPSVAYPPVLRTEVGKTVCNYISWCSSTHRYAFIFYAALLVGVIVLVWLANNGTLTLFNSAVAVTIILAVMLLLMFIHWYWAMKGVIPECGSPGWSFAAWAGAGAGGNAGVSGNVQPMQQVQPMPQQPPPYTPPTPVATATASVSTPATSAAVATPVASAAVGTGS